MRYRRRHLADGSQLFRLNQLSDLCLELGVEPKQVGPGLPQAFGHSAERASKLANFVTRARHDRVIQLSGANDDHGPGKLAEWTGQTSRYKPGAKQPARQR